MNKKSQKLHRQNQSLNKFLNKQEKNEEKSNLPANTRTEGKKKICTNLNNFLNSKDKPPSPPPPARKLTFQQIVKSIDTQQLLQKCPNLLSFIQILSLKSQLPSDIVASLVKKHLQSSIQSLWSSKYAPKQISQLFNIPAGQKIKEWMNAFFEYKNKMVAEEDSMFSSMEAEKSNRIYQNIRENQWALLALIVRGRPGVGKTSAIRAVAAEMKIDMQECGSDYNQTKYLKQKNQSTQSQSVKNAYTKKIKVEKNAQMITKFMNPPAEKEAPKENKKMQMIHNISLVFPESDAHKFYNELSRCVSLSKIPFIVTNSGQKLPKECQKYDIIDFESGSGDKIHKILWVICHIEGLLALQKHKDIEKQTIFDSINSQISTLEYKQLCNESKIRDICQLYNYRLDYIFTFLQHHKQNFQSISIYPFLIKKYENLNQDQLLDEICFIDFSKMVQPLQNGTIHEKFEDNNTSLESTNSDKSEKSKEDQRSILKDLKHKISLLASQDTIKQQQNSLFKRFSFVPQEHEGNPISSINISVHRGIKESLTKMANKQLNMSYDKLKSSLKASQLSFLPMLIRQKRANRSSRISINALKKIYDQSQFCYLNTFGHLVKQ